MGSSNASFSLTTAQDQFTELAWDLLLAAQDQARRWRHGGAGCGAFAAGISGGTPLR